MNINILSTGHQLTGRAEIIAAAALEASIVNHCRMNICDAATKERALTLMSVEMAAQQRYDVLMEMLA